MKETKDEGWKRKMEGNRQGKGEGIEWQGARVKGEGQGRDCEGRMSEGKEGRREEEEN